MFFLACFPRDGLTQEELAPTVKEGVAFLERGDLPSALERFETAVEENPGDHAARFYLGEVFYRLRRFSEAKPQFLEALRLNPASQSARYKLGRIGEEEADYDRAYDHYQRVIELVPDRPEARAAASRLRQYGETREAFRTSHEQMERANRAIAEGDPEAAIAALKAVVQVAPFNVQGFYLLGFLYQQTDQITQAIDAFERTATLNPNALDVLYRLAALYEGLEEFDRAIAKYQEVIRRGPGSEEAESAQKKLAIIGEDPALARRGFELFSEGNALLAEGKLEEALSRFQELLSFLPGNSEAHMAVAQIYLRQGKEDEAITEYKKIHAVDPDHYPSRYALGLLYTNRGLLDEARPEFNMVIDRAREERLVENARNLLAAIDKEAGRLAVSAEAREYQSRAVELSRAGRFSEAIDALAAAIELQPENPFFHQNLGIVYYNIRQFDKAFIEFKKAAELRPDYFPAHYRLGIFYEGAHLYREAIAAYERVLSLTQGDEFEAIESKKRLTDLSKQLQNEQVALGHTIVGSLYLARGDMESARIQFEKALQVDPNGAANHYNLAFLEELEGYKDFARAGYHDAISVNPFFVQAHYRLGLMNQIEGNLDRAVDDYQRALEQDPAFALAHLGLAEVFEQKRFYLPARERYRLFLDHAPRELEGIKSGARRQLDFYEKRYRLTLTHQLISYDSNFTLQSVPVPEYASGLTADLLYYAYRSNRFSVPIEMRTDNTMYVRSQTFLNFSSFGPRFELSLLNYSFSLSYRFTHVHTHVGRSSRRQELAGSIVWRPAFSGIGDGRIQWTDFLPAYVSASYSYEDVFSYENLLFDAVRRFFSLSLGRGFPSIGVLSGSLSYFKNSTVRPSLRHTDRIWSLSYLKDFGERVHLSLSHEMTFRDFEFPETTIGTTVARIRKNRLQRITFQLSYDFTSTFSLDFDVIHQVNRSNLGPLLATDPIAVNSGLSPSVGSYRKTNVETAFIYRF